MRRLAEEGKLDPAVRDLALALTASCDPKSWTCELRRLFSYVRDRIRYVRDVLGVETVATPARTIELGAGDCDDQVVLLAALLGSIGHPSRFVALGWRPRVFEHVILEANIGGRWIPLDPTEPADVGWSPPDPAIRLVQEVS